MRKAFIISIVIFITISVNSQGYQIWSDPVALTDSSSFNSNPEVVVFDYEVPFMFYEKRQSQSGNREIWWKLIYDNYYEEQLLIGGNPEVDYRNPKIVNFNFLVFECNATINNQYDLFGAKLEGNGVGNIFRLTATEHDENSFYGVNYLEICCWESDGDIIIAGIQNSGDTLQFTNTEIIDTGNCLEPVCRSNFISWRKVENEESHIFYSEKEYPSTQWSDPDTIIQKNDNTHLSISRTTEGWGEGYCLCWQSSDRIYFSGTFGWPFEIISPDILGIENYYEPTSFDLVFLNKSAGLYSFAGEVGSTRNIYIMDYEFFSDVINITNDTLTNKNPKMFSGGEYGYFYDVFNIWQTEINGFDVLFMSTASYLFGGIKENDAFQLDIFPNPVSNNQNITISSAKNIKIYSAQIYSVSGELILETDFDPNSYSYEINLGNALPGVYFIKIQTSEGEIVRKLIKR